MAVSRLTPATFAEAEKAYRRVLGLGVAGRNDEALYWAHLGLGAIQVARGNLLSAKAEYELGKAIVDRLAQSDPSNVGWQKDLGIGNERLGDVLMA